MPRPTPQQLLTTILTLLAQDTRPAAQQDRHQQRHGQKRTNLAGASVVSLAGAAATTWFAHAHAEEAVIPLGAWAGGLVAAIVIGALAGLLPAIRAARLSPTQALWSV